MPSTSASSLSRRLPRARGRCFLWNCRADAPCSTASCTPSGSRWLAMSAFRNLTVEVDHESDSSISITSRSHSLTAVPETCCPEDLRHGRHRGYRADALELCLVQSRAQRHRPHPLPLSGWRRPGMYAGTFAGVWRSDDAGRTGARWCAAAGVPSTRKCRGRCSRPTSRYRRFTPAVPTSSSPSPKAACSSRPAMPLSPRGWGEAGRSCSRCPRNHAVSQDVSRPMIRPS